MEEWTYELRHLDARRQDVFCFTLHLIFSGKEPLLPTGLKAKWDRFNLEAIVNTENLVPAKNKNRFSRQWHVTMITI
jgi:hypothetical protein